MNQQFSNIELLIQQSVLSDEEKQKLLKEILNAEKQWNILEFELDHTEKEKKTTAVLLEETIEELGKKRKDVKAQNKELEIQNALERVRAVAMGMKEPADMMEVCKTISQQLELLNVKEIRNVQTAIFYESKGTYMNYEYYAKHDKTFITETSYTNNKIHLEFAEKMLKGNGEFMTAHIIGDEVKDWITYQKTTNVFIDTFLETASSLNYYWYSLGPVALGISTYEPLKEEDINLFKRFLKVFELSYTRYLDIEQAIAQARESQIQLALERVRARTMAMEKSDELSETVYVLFQQFKELGEQPDQATIGVINEDEKVIEYWVTMYGQLINKVFKFSIDEPNVTNKIYKAWKENKKSLVIDLSGNALTEFMTYRAGKGGAAINPNEKRRIINVAFFSKGLLNVQSNEERSEESIKLLERFASVFEQTYTRFLDLQKAEAQAREAQIELGLERVRARAMAMQTSEELNPLIGTVFTELTKLDFLLTRCVILIYEGKEKGVRWWMANSETPSTPMNFFVKYADMPFFNEYFKGWYNRSLKWQYCLEGENKIKTDDFLFTETELSLLPDFVIAGMRAPDRVYLNASFNNFGNLTLASLGPLSEEHFNILLRFAKVFDLTYTRFNDLKQAEAQAREAQIEAALERVRSRSLSVYKSDEFNEVIKMVFERLQELEIPMTSASINIVIDGSKDTESYICGFGEGGLTLSHIRLIYFDHPIANDRYNAYEKGLEFFTKTYNKEEKNSFFEYEFEVSDLKHIPADIKKIVMESKRYTISMALTKNSMIVVNDFEGKSLSSQQIDIVKRFTRVFEQAYIRFLDLQKAEAQVRENKIQLALERARAQSMMMQHSTELDDTLRVFHEQVLQLNISSAFSFLWLPDEEQDRHIFWAAWAENNSTVFKSKAINYPLDRNEPATAQCLIDWKSNDRVVSYYVPPAGVESYFAAWSELIAGVEKLKPEYFSDGLYYVEAFIKYGCFGVMTSVDLTQEEKKILERFAVEFERTYTRFLDLQKAEAQSRESQIQLALERVRARTMAMQHSNELADTAAILFSQFKNLGYKPDRITIGIMQEEKQLLDLWATNGEADEPRQFYQLPFNEPHVLSKCVKAWKEQKKSLVLDVSGQPLKEYVEFWRSFVAIQDARSMVDQVFFNFAFFSKGYLGFISFEHVPPQTIELLERFAGVFDLTYTRFNDLKQAEASAREAQIELSLERVRAKTMAMHNSADVGETVAVMFDELVKLGIQTYRCGIGIMHDENKMEVWTAKAGADGKVDLVIGWLNVNLHPLLQGAFKGWRNKKESYSYELKDDDLINYFYAVNSYAAYPVNYDIASLPKQIFHNDFYFSEGTLFAFSLEKLSEEKKKIFKRFSAVFGQTYRRYLDLQKAEAQAREALIEAALERVRSRSLAVHKSDEFKEVIKVVFERLQELGFQAASVSINIFIKDSNDTDVFICGQIENGLMVSHFLLPYFDSPIQNDRLSAQKNNLDFFTKTYSSEEKNHFYDFAFGLPDLKLIPGEIKKMVYDSERYTISWALAKNSMIIVNDFGGNILSENEIDIAKRFARVFEQAYIRFLDLQKAEAQAREAQIEAALERVRGKAMAMHSSKDLAETIHVFYHEIELLSATPRRCGVGLMNKESRVCKLSTMTTTEEGEPVEVIGKLDLQGHPVLDGIYNNWLNQKEYHPVLRGNEIKEYYKLLRPQISYPDYPNDMAQYGYFFFFPEGGVFAWTEKELPEAELQIYRRFTSVLSLTYKRCHELQQAEANAKEAVKQSALDRIRADIASMRTISDLDRITPLIWNELTILGINFIRCGVFIMDDSQQLMHTFLSTPDGKAIAAFHIPYTTPGNIKHVISHWHENKNYIDHWDESAFTDFAHMLTKQGGLTSPEQYLKTIPHGGFYLHFLPFLQGMLYVGNINQLSEEEINLIQSVADAFSTAYARYEDFNKLEAAKQQVDKTLTELKQTQQQLVQSEKMASLGELTAGIAHEIQNPLNFVNNFSEVSKELLDEMRTALENGNKEEAEQIANDIIQNLEKINHHGKRADAIVKGMLQHSRKSEGKKEPTDINALCDEYLRLSFHGMRAKNKSFNSDFKTEFDNSIEKINIVPQDIGRVLLNLFNNAFYAVNEKKKTADENYKSFVSVETKKINDKIEIQVSDNGNGIPQNIVDKIFQPFFTTKPTGQGTGLGLSLAYDIITKEHNGTIKVESKESEGTSFIINLPML